MTYGKADQDWLCRFFTWRENERVSVVVYTVPDDRKDYRERRFISIGLMSGIEITVVYTVRSGAFRIISARRSHPKERRKYHEERAKSQD
ncbi:MAG: BrnT family toxin [Synergistaceae bacterium]|jgi:hypothetical protein|nr:BrnT family toxin [Synergistaceae bacterium]